MRSIMQHAGARANPAGIPEGGGTKGEARVGHLEGDGDEGQSQSTCALESYESE